MFGLWIEAKRGCRVEGVAIAGQLLSGGVACRVGRTFLGGPDGRRGLGRTRVVGFVTVEFADVVSPDALTDGAGELGIGERNGAEHGSRYAREGICGTRGDAPLSGGKIKT